MNPKLNPETTSGEFFERMYRQAADPWSFGSNSYELGRYAAILRALEGRRFRRAFEPACSIGVLTEQLAAICDRVEAMDISATAVAATQARCRTLSQVHTTCGALPGFIPSGVFDLVVFSEVGYYFEEITLRALAEDLVDRIEAGGVLLAAHWLGHSEDHILNGDRVHEVLRQTPGLRLDLAERPDLAEREARAELQDDVQGQRCGFRLDRWVRV